MDCSVAGKLASLRVAISSMQYRIEETKQHTWLSFNSFVDKLLHRAQRAEHHVIVLPGQLRITTERTSVSIEITCAPVTLSSHLQGDSRFRSSEKE